MNKKVKSIGIFIIMISVLASSSIIEAKSSTEIVFKDKNLENTLSKFFDYNGTFTQEKAAELSKKNTYISLEDSKITDLEGLQYFNNVITVYLGGNNLNNLQPLSEMKGLQTINICNNSSKGNKFEKALSAMGKNEELSELALETNGLANIKILSSIGDIENYTGIYMKDNKIQDILLLKEATNLETLDLANNRISDVTPLKNLKKLTYIDLHDNCIIDYKPIKQLIDKMFEDYDYSLNRYDFYTNPVNFEYNDKKIDFPYLTVYYQNQGYAEAIPLLKAFGGSAKYDKKTGTLTCKYDGNVLVLKDFSKKYTLNGEEKNLKYPMRRMQFDLAYVPVKDVCEVLGLKYNVVKKRYLYQGDDVSEYAPKLVEISKAEKKL